MLTPLRLVSRGRRAAGAGLTHIDEYCEGGNRYGSGALESNDAVESHP